MKVYEKGNGNVLKLMFFKVGVVVVDVKEFVLVKLEQVRFFCFLCIVWCMGLVVFVCEGCMKFGNMYVYFVVICFLELLRVSYR